MTEHFHRTAAWAVYLCMNALTYYFNINLIISIFRLKKKKTSIDVLLAGLASGFVISSTGCFFPCLFNLMNTFQDQMCFFEAYLHIVGMVVQFLNVATIAFRTYLGITRKITTFTIKRVYLAVLFSWILSFGGTFIFGLFSEIYLVASGTFCFYTWTSVALLAWAWPVAALSGFCMSYWYWKIFSKMKKVQHIIHEDDPSKENDIALRLASLIFLFILGYSGLICQSLYEVFIGRAAVWGDITAACIVLTYWVTAPLAYAHANHRLQLSAVFYCSPALLKEEKEETPPKSKTSALSTLPQNLTHISQSSVTGKPNLSEILDLNKAELSTSPSCPSMQSCVDDQIKLISNGSVLET